VPAIGWITRKPKRAGQAVAVLVVLVLAGVLGWRVVSSGGGVANQLDKGKPVPAPALVLGRLDTDGTLSLASLRGKVVAINFWASWCGPCRDEAPLLEGTWRENRAKGFVMLGVDANDSSGEARKFMRKYGLTYPIVHDAHGSTLGRWGVPGLPTTFVVDRKGRVVAKFLGGLRVGDNAESFRREIRRALAT
jgi:cytochrome c biogenesis protein CcmG/thiol:disulfide interchange protein DsbE